MHRKFIALVAATSIAITALGALPAAAGERDTARAIAAIVGLAVIGKVIHDRNKKKKERRVHTYQPETPVYEYDSRHRHGQANHKHRHGDTYHRHSGKAHRPPRYEPPHVQPRPLPRKANRKLLPKSCFRNFDTSRGSVQMFSRRCLKKNYAYVPSLPSRCEYIFSTTKGDRRGYEARCMRDAGYRLARG